MIKFNYEELGIDVQFTDEEKEKIIRIKNNKKNHRKNKPIAAKPTALPKNQQTKEIMYYDRYMKKLKEMYGPLDESEYAEANYNAVINCICNLTGKDFNRLRMGN